MGWGGFLSGLAGPTKYQPNSAGSGRLRFQAAGLCGSPMAVGGRLTSVAPQATAGQCCGPQLMSRLCLRGGLSPCPSPYPGLGSSRALVALVSGGCVCVCVCWLCQGINSNAQTARFTRPTVCVCVCDAQIFQIVLKLRGSTIMRPNHKFFCSVALSLGFRASGVCVCVCVCVCIVLLTRVDGYLCPGRSCDGRVRG